MPAASAGGEVRCTIASLAAAHREIAVSHDLCDTLLTDRVSSLLADPDEEKHERVSLLRIKVDMLDSSKRSRRL